MGFMITWVRGWYGFCSSLSEMAVFAGPMVHCLLLSNALIEVKMLGGIVSKVYLESG